MGCQCAKQKEEDELLKRDPLEEVNEVEKEQVNNDQQEIKEIGPSINSQEVPDMVQIKEQNLEAEKNDEEKQAKYSDYPEKMLELINKIRQNPVSYADVIEDSIQNIIEDENPAQINQKIIFKKKVKVALTKGKPAFLEAAEILRKMSPLPPLEMKNDICVPLPETEEEVKNTSYLKQQVNILRENKKIEVFFKDLIKIPDVSALLLIVDDSAKNPGRKRQAVLNRNYKYIGINSKFIGKTFIAYFTFSS